jgi:hypothetical protein
VSDELLSDPAAAAEPIPEEASAGEAVGALRTWIINHDESWLFTISYVGLAVVLSIWISLFWLVAVVGAHVALEWVRQSHLASRPGSVPARVLWEVKLDLALVLFALALTAYLEVILGVAGLGGAARLGIQSGARLAGWARVLRGVLLSLDDAAQVARVALARGSGPEDTDEPGTAAAPWTRWSVGDHIAIWLGVVCVVLIFAAPALTDHTYASLWPTLLAELHPAPGEPE